MAAKDDVKKELWVGWTRDAISRYQPPDEVDGDDALINDMADIATGYADMMIDEYERRFEGGTTRRTRKRPDDDPDDD